MMSALPTHPRPPKSILAKELVFTFLKNGIIMEHFQNGNVWHDSLISITLRAELQKELVPGE